jgi:hypothetical protein
MDCTGLRFLQRDQQKLLPLTGKQFINHNRLSLFIEFEKSFHPGLQIHFSFSKEFFFQKVAGNK